MALNYSLKFLSESGIKMCSFATISIIFDTKPKLACRQTPRQIPEILQSNSNPQRPENHPETSFKPYTRARESWSDAGDVVDWMETWWSPVTSCVHQGKFLG
jgi:hypothetical protein